MQHINTTETIIRKIKSKAKKIQSEKGVPISQALEISAQQNGYESFHHATKCAAKTQKINISNVLGLLTLRIYDDNNSVSFCLKNEEKLYSVTDELDKAIDELVIGCGGMETMGELELNAMITTCRKLTKKEPAFLDGYAHWIGALTTLGHPKEAIAIGQPVFEAALALFKTAPKKYFIDYYVLGNRPFYRLAHHLVLALYQDNQNDAARKISKLMLRLNPNDNTGFRFLLEPLEE